MPVWRNPAAWFALSALAIPIAVHLLARTRALVVAFPSLRFIDVSRLAARKRRRLTDLALLAMRLLALTLAIAACADPLFLTPSRRAAWGSRVSRAIVVDESASMSRVSQAADEAARTADRESQGTLRALILRSPSTSRPVLMAASASAPASAAAAAGTAPASASIAASVSISAAASTSLRDGVSRAVAWLRTAPPSRREIVIISDFQIGTIDAAVLREVPDDIGLRFVRVGQASRPKELTVDTRMVSTRNAGGGFAWKHARVRVTENATAVAPASTASVSASAQPLAPISITPSENGFDVSPFGLRVTLARADRARAMAVMQAVLSEGVPAPAARPRPTPTSTPAPAHAQRTLTLHLASDAVPPGAAGAPAASATPAQLSPVSAPWMADVLHRITTADAVLADAVAASGTQASDTNTLQLTARVSADSPITPLLFRAVLTALAEPDMLAEAEVRTIPDSALTTWTRPPAEPSTEALRNVEESDRRWFWAAALAVQLVEMWLRRDRQHAQPREAAKEVHEHAA